MRVLFILLCFSISLKIHAQQQIKGLPIQFNQYMRAYPMINPASSGSLSKLEINAGNQRHGGNWSNINTFYFNANIRLTKDLKIENNKNEKPVDEYSENTDTIVSYPKVFYKAVPNSYHVAGLNLIGDKEGVFLNRNGIYGLYAWHTHLKENMILSGGVALGIKNYSISDNYVTGGGSSFAPDGNVGVWLYDYNYHLGFSVNQIFNSKLKPLNETTVLIPQYNFTAGRSWEVSHALVLKPSVLIGVASQTPVNANVTLGSLWQNIASLTLNYNYKKGVTTMIGIEKIKIGENVIKAMFSYYFPVGRSNQININNYEITLNYYLRPNKEHTIFQ
jgi:type IX secretion system PorP/SprF family membrane protein